MNCYGKPDTLGGAFLMDSSVSLLKPNLSQKSLLYLENTPKDDEIQVITKQREKEESKITCLVPLKIRERPNKEENDYHQ